MEKNQPRIAKLFKTALLGLATVVLATACNKTTEPPIRPDETAKYNISGQVLGNNLENSDLTALAGVTVSYKFGSVSDETTTDANGYFSFEGLVSAGRYDLTFSLGGYNTTYYSLEFPTLRGTIIDYQLKITMVKLPAGMTTVDPAAGGTVLAIALLGTLHYRRFCGTKFGGITGDLAGWFLCRMELAMVLGLWAVGILTGIF